MKTTLQEISDMIARVLSEAGEVQRTHPSAGWLREIKAMADAAIAKDTITPYCFICGSRGEAAQLQPDPNVGDGPQGMLCWLCLKRQTELAGRSHYN
ncbi:MAG: hypothetical protein ACLPTQ_25740 [Terriglobales bacterium]